MTSFCLPEALTVQDLDPDVYWMTDDLCMASSVLEVINRQDVYEQTNYLVVAGHEENPHQVWQVIGEDFKDSAKVSLIYRQPVAA